MLVTLSSDVARGQAGTHEDIQRHVEIRLPTERSFAWVWTVVLTGVGLWPLWRGGSVRWWALSAAAVMLLAGYALPSLLRWPNKLWFHLGMLLARITTPVVTAVLFYAVFFPMGMLVRLFRPDPLGRRWNADAKSYWIQRTPPGPPPDTMTNQF